MKVREFGRNQRFGTEPALHPASAQGGEAMIPLISIALAMISNVTDLAHMFVSDQLDDRPAGVTFYFENRHEEATFAFFDEHGDAQADVLKEFSHFVRCWRTGREKAMNARTVEIVTQIASHFGVDKIDVVSG